MIEQKIRTISETLARSIGRRELLHRAGIFMASGVTLFALGTLFSRSPARAALHGAAPLTPVCSPPGPFCNLDGNFHDPNGCHGAMCFQHRSAGQIRACHIYYTFYAAGCWTYHGPNEGHWTCCDCQCDGGSTCGCAQFLLDPVTVGE